MRNLDKLRNEERFTAERLLFSINLEGGRRVDLFESTDRNLGMHVDGIQGMMVAGSSVKLNFFTRGYVPDPVIERREVVCRMVLGIESFLSIVDYLSKQPMSYAKTSG